MNQITVLLIYTGFTYYTTDHDAFAESYLTMQSGVMELPSSHANASAINNAFNEHQLQNFVISNDCLQVLELLGGGVIWHMHMP